MQLAILNEFSRLCLETARELNVLVRLEFPVPQGTTRRPPIHLALVLDRSGSMQGAKLELTKQAAIYFMNWLTRRDYLTVVTYDDNVELLVASTLLTDKRSVAEKIKSIDPGGGTNLSGGWLRALSELRDHHDTGTLCRVLLLTDGLANRGITESGKLCEIGAKNRKKEIPTTTVGFGKNFDEKLLKAIAESSNGRFHFVSEPEGLAKAFQDEFGELAAVIGQNLELRIETNENEGVSVAEILTDLPTEQTGKALTVRLGDVRAGDVKQLVLRLRLTPGRASATTLGAEQIPKNLTTLATVAARLDSLLGEMEPEHQQACIEADFSLGAADVARADPEVRREVWLAEAAKLKLCAARQVDRDECALAAAALRRHVKLAAEMAKDPTEQFVREEISRLLDLAKEVEICRDKSGLTKILTVSASQHASGRGAYSQRAGMKKLQAELSPKRPEEVMDVVSAAELELLGQKYDSERIDKFKLALRELLENALEHGCAGLPDAMVRVECQITANYARMTVWDDGPGFDYAAKLKEEQKKVLEPGKRGRGLLLLKRLADRIEFQTGNGTRVELVLERQTLAVHSEIAQPGSGTFIGKAFCIAREINNDRGTVVLRPAGALDAHTFQQFETCLNDLFRSGYYKLVVDLSAVEYLSSSGAGVFIGSAAQAREHGGNIVLLNPISNVKAVFDLLGLAKVLPVCHSINEAMEFF